MVGTAALFALMIQQVTATVPVLEVPSHGDENIVLQAWVNGFDMSAEEASAWRVLGPAMLTGCKGYTPDQVRRHGTIAGRPITVETFDDTMRLEVVLPAEGWEESARLFLSLITQPTLRSEDVEAEIRTAAFRAKEPWILALEPWNLMVDRLTPADVTFLYEKVIRPENLNFVAYGPIEPGVVGKFIQGEMNWWRVPAKPVTPRNLTKLEPILKSGTGITSIEMRAKPLTPSTQFNSARILATYAIGVGKDTSLYRRIREENAWAYEVDALLWPTRKGWEPRFVMFKKATADDHEFVDGMRAMIEEDIEKWDAQTLLRSRVMAQTSLRRATGVGGFWVSKSGSLRLTQSERAAWRGYMQLVGSPAISPSAWADMLDVVDLVTMKAQAKLMLSECETLMISGF